MASLALRAASPVDAADAAYRVRSFALHRRTAGDGLAGAAAGGRARPGAVGLRTLREGPAVPGPGARPDR